MMSAGLSLQVQGKSYLGSGATRRVVGDMYIMSADLARTRLSSGASRWFCRFGRCLQTLEGAGFRVYGWGVGSSIC